MTVAPPLARDASVTVPESKENSISSREGVYEPSGHVEDVLAPADDVYVPKHNQVILLLSEIGTTVSYYLLPAEQATQLDWPSVD